MFVGMLSFSIAVVNKVEIGLDQRLSMPDVRIYLFTPFAYICILKNLKGAIVNMNIYRFTGLLCAELFWESE